MVQIYQYTKIGNIQISLTGIRTNLEKRDF